MAQALTKYCVCQQDDTGIMIECIVGTGGCNGWVHPSCCGLLLSTEELEAMDSYICPLCEKQGVRRPAPEALTTAEANAKVQGTRQEKSERSRKGWVCDNCGDKQEDGRVRECPTCGTKRSRRSKKKKHKHKHREEERPVRREARKRSKKRSRKMAEQLIESDGSDKEKSGSISDELYDSDGPPVKKKKEEGLATTELPTMVIEKIMGNREVDGKQEYLVKWRHFSYMHASWEQEQTLLELDATNKLKIKRFLEKKHLTHANQMNKKRMEDVDDEIEYFNPEYLEIQRILADRKDDPIPPDPVNFPDAPLDDGVRYLVKWRVLPYTEATWERACDLDDDSAIESYRKTLTLPPKDMWEPPPRPSLRQYKKLDNSPLFGQEQELQLRSYQLEGLNWLMWNWFNERPSILADEMGLGKTIQTLAFLDRLRKDPDIRCRGPFLVVAPLALIIQWQNECETWTDMNCVVYHGTAEARELIREYEFYYLDDNGRPDKKKPFRFHLLITTYEIAIKDISILSKVKWPCLIVDEAHRLKNQSSRLVEQLRALQRAHCVLLTGTPLQNKTEELWALLNFLDGKSFPSLEDFLAKFGDLHEARQVADLHRMLKPYLLRRVKEDVEKSLPPKEETIVEVELTPVQKQWYRAIYEKNTAFLQRGGGVQNMPNLMNVMMELRKCCNHPYLNNGVEDVITEGLTTDQERHDMMVKCCGKMVLLDKLLPKLLAQGHKVLVFSQMVRVLDIIEDYLRFSGYLFERLDGNIRGNERQAAINRFVKPEYERFVMLLSTKAGGLGLNLTAADTVLIFDSDWNPHNDLQAQARAHRIGQTQSVKIYRLVTRKTYEMHMFHKASLKLGLDKAVLSHMRREKEGENGSQEKKSKAEEAKEIDELLKRGAYDVFREDDQAAQQFCDADIDQILQRSAQVVQYADESNSSFSKASFVSATTDDDVDIEDPDFWKKAVGLADPEPGEDEEALPLQRKRTRVNRFGTLGDSAEEEEDFNEEEKDEYTEANKEKETREWTANGRERVQRALMHYGFGRWELIRKQSGGSRSISEVAAFAKAFLYVCGLGCVEPSTGSSSSSKDEAPFVKSVVRASTMAREKGLVDEATLPTVLQDEEFMTKMKQSGGRRVLVRLDMLHRLHEVISSACDALDEAYDGEKELPKKETADIDERVHFHGVQSVVDAVHVPDAQDRPHWTQLTPWWGLEADRNLLVGVFLHGYGRSSQILSDSRLCFAKEDEDREKNPEVQAMNRLLFWLLSVEESRRQKEIGQERKERAQIENQRKVELEKQQRKAALRRVELKAKQLAQMDTIRVLASLHNIGQLPPALPSQKARLKDWTKEERRSFSYMIALYGAPRILAKSAVSGAPENVEDGAPKPFAWHTDSLSWTNIVQWGRLEKTGDMAKSYYEHKFLPRCRELAGVKVDPLGSDQRAVALSDMIGVEFVDGQEGVMAHGLKARNMAWVTLRRAQLLDDVRHVLTHELPALVQYLRSGSPHLVQHMPVWWCPWLHDLGIFYGMAKHGIANWPAMRGDRTLPFHRDARAHHIREVFLDGTPSFTPLYRHLFETEEAMDKWFHQVLEELPSLAVLERKVQAICADVLQAGIEDGSVDAGSRYEEPSSRREYSQLAPEDPLERWLMDAADNVDRYIEPPKMPREVMEKEAAGSLESLAHAAESQERQENGDKDENGKGHSSNPSMQMVVS